MRAFVLDHAGPVSSRPLRLASVPTPEPGPGEVRVKVHACGLCRTDLHVVEGELPERRPHVTPGHQIVGVVDALGPGVDASMLGARVGVAWLHRTDGTCRFCVRGRENLCERADFTGWTVDGGFAEHTIAPADFVYPIPEGFGDLDAAPLLCAGIIGFRCLRTTGIETWRGARLGIYGFGAAGHVAIQIARGRGAEVFVCTRDRERHQALAVELGATWVGDTFDAPPAPLDAAIVFAPAGEIVPAALACLDPGGTLVLGGIHMSDIPSFPYARIYRERVIRSVANNTRADGRAFLAEAAALPVRTHVQRYAFDDVNDALIALKHDAVSGAAVLVVGAPP
ncbi:zinc-dependent alcohol dehydrogenase family protein [Sandaracinus amylolyticus]|uniref:zinc-dependent alcohol dehydrogenase family protein n=1 Tax=Sandaracinus amylolyticus TaxID=927083 RepID=UPI001F245AC9|nr:zinc-dependent alcohol dehydrogenase family protein [Sandaracinus amylolyticus]UJR80979.1 Propanol-preferring alcohol dehydrogenase [Sandaracinus amylolyticus]